MSEPLPDYVDWQDLPSRATPISAANLQRDQDATTARFDAIPRVHSTVHVAYDSLQSAIDRAADAGGGEVVVPAGTTTVPGDITWPRDGVRIVGQGPGASVLYSATDRTLSLVGSGGRWLPRIEGLTLDGIGIVAGATSADYANGLTIRDVEISNVTTGITFRHNSWLTRVENARIYTCGTGILHDFAPVGANSGAAMTYQDVAVFNCTGAAFQQDGYAIDGWHTSFVGCNFEHCEHGIVLSAVGDGSVDLVAQHFELNDLAHIQADSGRIRFTSGWAMGLPASNVALFDLSGTAAVSVRDARIGWDSASRLYRLTGSSALWVHPETVHTTQLGARLGDAAAPGNPATADSTGGVSLPRGSVLRFSRTTTLALGHAATNTTLLWVPSNDANDYRLEFLVTLSAAEAGNNLAMFLNPGTGGANAIAPIPTASTWARVELRWSLARAYFHVEFSDGSVWRAGANPSHAMTVARTLDARITGSGTATGSVSDAVLSVL